MGQPMARRLAPQFCFRRSRPSRRPEVRVNWGEGAPRTLRLASLLVAFPLASLAHGQNFTDLINTGIKALRQQGKIPMPEQVNPTQPTGFPNPPVKREGDLPRPGPLGPE